MNPTAPKQSDSARRPIKARGSRWARAWAAHLARWGVSPNAISLFSVVCAAGAAGCFVGAHFVEAAGARAGLYLLAIAGMQGRLVCNLLDGMVAIEGGRKSPSGEIFNDLPDRIADPLILAAAGYATGAGWGIELGWLAAVLALVTAYVRVLGQSAGARVYFVGPMAKQHRMATLTGACVAAAIGCSWGWDRLIMAIALGIICAGCVVTVGRRLRRIVEDLERQ